MVWNMYLKQPRKKKEVKWKQQYIIHMYRNKTACVSNVDSNLQSFCLGHILTVSNFPLVIYTAILNFLWLSLSWSVVLVLSTLLQLVIFEMGGKSKTLTMKVKFFIPFLISFAIATMPEKKNVSFTHK